MAAINKVSLGRLGRSEIWMWEPELLDGGIKTFSSLDIHTTAAGCRHLLLHTLSVKYSVTNGFSICAICIKLQMKSTMALTLCHAESPPGRFPSFFVYYAQPEDLLLGQRVIVHIMSRTVVSIHRSYPQMVYMALLDIYASMKYTWPRWACKARGCNRIRKLKLQFTFVLQNHEENICDCLDLFDSPFVEKGSPFV